MRHSEVEGLPAGKFERLTGVKHKMFRQLLASLRKRKAQKKRSGRPNKLLWRLGYCSR